MATVGPLLVPAHVNSDADFRTYAQAIHNALASLPDLTQGTDAGQINPATATRPTPGNYAGFDVFRFNDIAGESRPPAFKIEYGTGTSAVRPALRLTPGYIGVAGTFTASTQVWELKQASTRGIGGQAIFVASSGPGRVMFTSNLDPIVDQSFSHHFYMERAVDIYGALTGDLLVHIPSGTTAGAFVIGNSGVSPFQQDSRFLPTLMLASLPGWTLANGAIAVVPATAYNGKPIYGSGLVAYNTADIALPLTTFTADVLGARRTYLTLGASGLLVAPTTVATNAGGAAMRWE